MARPKLNQNINSTYNTTEKNTEVTMSTVNIPAEAPVYCTFVRNDRTYAEESRLIRRALDRLNVDVIQLTATSDDEVPRTLYDGGEIVGWDESSINAVFGPRS